MLRAWDAIDRERALTALALALLLAALFPEIVLFGAVLVERDLHLMYQPQAVAIRRALAGGEWPVWNRWVGFGQPLWANANSQLAYPPSWPGLFLSPGAALTLLVLLHTAWAALGAERLGRRIGLSRGAARLAACAWIASGPFVSSVNLWNHLCGIAWIPWMAWAAERTLELPSARRAAVWGACAAAPVLAGSPEACLLGVAASLPALRHLRSRSIPWVLVAAALAIGLSAAQWWPAWLVVRQSVRAVMPPAVALLWSAHPLSVAQAVWPVLQPDVPMSESLRMTLLEGRAPYLLSLYLGLPALVLAACAFAGDRRKALAVAGVGLAFGVLALGSHLPGMTALLGRVPALAALRYPVKAFFGVSLAASLLAGLGFDALARARSWLSGVVVLAGSGVCLALLHDRLAAGETTRVATALVAAAAALVLARLALPSARFAAATIVVAELVARHGSLNAAAPRVVLTEPPPAVEQLRPPPAQRVFVFDYDTGQSLRHLGRSQPYVFEVPTDSARWVPVAAQRMALAPYTAGSWGLEGSYDWDLIDLSPVVVARLGWTLRSNEDDPASWLRLIERGGVARVASLHELHLPGARQVHALRGLMREPLRIYEVPGALPRVNVVSGVRTARGPQDLLDPDFDPWHEVTIAGGDPRAAVAGFTGNARLVRLTEATLEVEVVASAPGYVVVRDAWDAGWRATVDGQPAAVERADEAFRAVAVPAGSHGVGMAYQAPGLRAGAVLSLLSVVAGLVLAVLGGTRVSAAVDNPGERPAP